MSETGFPDEWFLGIYVVELREISEVNGWPTRLNWVWIAVLRHWKLGVAQMIVSEEEFNNYPAAINRANFVNQYLRLVREKGAVVPKPLGLGNLDSRWEASS